MTRNDHTARTLPRRNALANARSPVRSVASAETADEPTSHRDGPEVSPA
ncbi:hypothetical protein U3A55_06315 [Salarchaeum sp. III]